MGLGLFFFSFLLFGITRVRYWLEICKNFPLVFGLYFGKVKI